MLKIGCHLSSSKGWKAMGNDALKIKANTFQFFTRNPRGSRAKALNLEDLEQLKDLMREHKFGHIVAHAPYTLNACSSEEKVREFARKTMAEDLKRMEYLPGNYYNFHPGNHMRQGIEKGIDQIAEVLNEILNADQKTVVLLETMAGKGTEVGRSFEELRAILDQVNLKDKMGICMDTCHVYDAGYDIVDHLDEVLTEFDRIIGLEYLKVVHLNDSKNLRGSHKDRHAKIGEGFIGEEAIKKIVCHPALRDLPFILETPNQLDGYEREIHLLRSIT